MSEGFEYDGEEVPQEMLWAESTVSELLTGMDEIVQLSADMGATDGYGQTATREAYDQICDELTATAQEFQDAYDAAVAAAGEDSAAVERLDELRDEAVATAQAVFAGLTAQYEEVSPEERMRQSRRRVEDKCGISLGSGPYEYDV